MIGKFIKLNRIKKDLTQEQLGELLDVTKSYISLIENDKTEITEEMKENINKVLEINLDEFTQQSLIEIDNKDDEEIKRISELMKANPENTKLILDKVLKEPDLMLLAAKAINGNKTALDRFNKLVG